MSTGEFLGRSSVAKGPEVPFDSPEYRVSAEARGKEMKVEMKRKRANVFLTPYL